MNNTWIDELAGGDGQLDPRPGFEAELRSTLTEEWNGRSVVGLRDRQGPDQSTRRWPLMAAAALLLVAVAGLVVVAGDGPDDSPVLTTPTVASTTPEPSVTAEAVPTTVLPDDLEAAPVPSSVPAPDDSAVPATTAAPAPTTTPTVSTAPPSSEIDSQQPLAGWPTSSAAPPSFTTVPRLFPTVPIPGATGALRTAGGGEIIEADTSDYNQVWYAADGSAYVEVITQIGRELYVPPRIDEVTIEPWDRAWFNDTVEGAVNMTLIAPEGQVDITSQGLERDAILNVARTLTRRPDARPGWDVGTLPPSLVAFGETGGANGWRRVQWISDASTNLGLAAEMEITVGSPGSLRQGFPLRPNGYNETVTSIDGADAFVNESVSSEQLPGQVSIVWSPEPNVTVKFVHIGTLEDALAIVNSIEPVDQALWDTVTVLDTRPGHDGCDSLFC